MSEASPPTYRLRLPGPTAVPQRVREATAAPVLNHRGSEFRDVLAECETRLRGVLGTANDILFFASSGTGMMEAALANVLAPGDEALVVAHGRFGERFAEVAQTLGAAVDEVGAPWGENVPVDAVAERLAGAAYRAVVVVHNESSTGVVADLGAIGALLADSDTLLVVDSVSGAGGIAVRQDRWGVDVLVTASQKALMCPPGVGLMSVSPKAWAGIARRPGAPRVYFDLLRARAAHDRGETPFTPPVSLIGGLREALRMIDEEGVEQVLARHHRLATALRAGAEALGLPSFPRASAISDTVSVLSAPEGMDAGDIVRHLYEHHGTVVAGARNKLRGKVVRIGTMGACTEEDVLTDLAHLESTLRALGRAPAPGSGVAAARRVLGRE